MAAGIEEAVRRMGNGGRNGRVVRVEDTGESGEKKTI